ncbi:hypothetical protein RvY_01302-2 [Ramazzottius varieornatus]|uniref:Peptide-N-glycosidase F N-terminal domain-containing protein n=1 Tax=Ramazzottius varieornatus TaxID=947166 RepID=A0A1D1UQJ8_RAMVA|nr:hypothetical protein RvY_01302-2 [Ramazzottius varieornatus]
MDKLIFGKPSSPRSATRCRRRFEDSTLSVMDPAELTSGKAYKTCVRVRFTYQNVAAGLWKNFPSFFSPRKMDYWGIKFFFLLCFLDANIKFPRTVTSLLIPEEQVQQPAQDRHEPPSRSFFRHVVPYGQRPDVQTIGWKNQVALKNIFSVPKHMADPSSSASSRRKRGTSTRDLKPGDSAPPFTIITTEGTLRYPQGVLTNVPIIIHTYDKRSGFLEALWNTPQSFDGIIRGHPLVHYIFLSTSLSAYADAHWMKKQVVGRMIQLRVPEPEMNVLLERMHFATTPAYELGNWIPDILKEWRCEDHNCGYYQASFQAESSTVPLSLSTFDCLMNDPNCAARMNGETQPVVLKRQDARYDWLPNMFVGFGSRSVPVVFAGAGCEKHPLVRNKIALLTDGACSYFKKVFSMQGSGALGVIVVANIGEAIHDINCQGSECSTVLSIPATMVPYDERIMTFARQGTFINVKFQTTQSDNFYVGIDRKGLLQEMGWLLFPSFHFFSWQVHGMDFISDLQDQVATQADLVINVFNRTKMQGDAGAVASNIKIPWDGNRMSFAKMTLDLQLQCPGATDRTCAEWDHTVHLFVCCDDSPMCGMELGRWISPYRRHVGRWLTDASHLIPLLSHKRCNFTMKHPPWTDPWYPILNLRFAEPLDWLKAQRGDGGLYPDHIEPIFIGSETFDISYNTKWPPYHFHVPTDVRRVTTYALITGHGSDNNNCAEFCVTSHNFLLNEANLNSRIFTNAGTPQGCAHRVKFGVEPNQHGTWLYGRNGWCPGENVAPWTLDITDQVLFGQENRIRYYGHYNNTDPNPTANPGFTEGLAA